MTDKLSGVEQGRVNHMRQHSASFRARVLEQKAATLAAAATAQDEADREAARAERQRLAEEQRANRGPATVESGRKRYENRHKNQTIDGERTP